MAHTPSADAEILVSGRPVRAPVVPVSPTGCPTSDVVTRAVRASLDRYAEEPPPESVDDARHGVRTDVEANVSHPGG